MTTRTDVNPTRPVPALHDEERRLLRAGAVLFGLGLITGFGMPLYANPRMGLASHLEGVMNGMLLMILGLAWSRLALGPAARRALAALALAGTYANWATTLACAALGVGGRMMPLAGGGHVGGAAAETAVAVALTALSVAMVATSAVVVAGLARTPSPGCQAAVPPAHATSP